MKWRCTGFPKVVEITVKNMRNHAVANMNSTLDMGTSKANDTR